METIIDNRVVELIQKCEVMVQLTTKACYYWNILRLLFQMPLIFTSSIMCVLNSFDNGDGKMKIPNVVVNGFSVLLMSYSTSLKVVEKVDMYKNLSNEFLLLAHQIEGINPDEIDRNLINNLIEKYDKLCFTVNFEDIPTRYKLEIINKNKNKKLPLQLNGASGLTSHSPKVILNSDLKFDGNNNV